MLGRDDIAEKEYLIRIADGDEKAFEVLLSKYSDLLGAYIYKLTHSRESAEEIVQDVFLKIWLNREALRSINNFQAWLYIVSKNSAINAVRKMVREKLDLSAMSLHDAPDQENQSDWLAEKLSIVEKAITHLPPQQKKVYILSRKEGYSYKQIANEMNISTETVKKYLQHASRFVLSEVGNMVKISLLAFFLKKF